MSQRFGAFLLPILVVMMCASLVSAPIHAPVRIIFDTDMGNDIDDTLALAMLHSLMSRGEVRLLAVTATKDNPQVGPVIDVINTFYGRPEIPIGVVKGGKTPEGSPILSVPLGEENSDGTPVYPHQLQSSADAPNAVLILRQALAAQPDHSVTIVQVGFSTNLARLLKGDRLIRRKVKVLVAMAGNFVKAEPEYNVKTDIPSAQAVLGNWPTPIVCSGYEVGEKILYPATSIEHDFNYVDHHPVADSYRAFQKMPYDRPTWDLTAALYGARSDGQYFELSEPGRIEVDGKGNTVFRPAADGNARYLIVRSDDQRKNWCGFLENWRRKHRVVAIKSVSDMGRVPALRAGQGNRCRLRLIPIGHRIEVVGAVVGVAVLHGVLQIAVEGDGVVAVPAVESNSGRRPFRMPR